MKKKSCFVWVILAALLLMMTAGCGSKEEDIKATMAKMVGSWDYFPEDADNYQIRYIISQDGFITQQAWAYDDEGNEIDLSLGDMAGFSFEVISKDTIKLKGKYQGVESEAHEIHVEFPDDNTMMLNDSKYIRAGSK